MMLYGFVCQGKFTTYLYATKQGFPQNEQNVIAAPGPGRLLDRVCC